MAISVRKYHLWVRKVQLWWRKMRRRLDVTLKNVEDNFIKAEAAVISKASGFVPKVQSGVRKKFIKGELRSRRYRHLAFLENFEREFEEYKRQVVDYRNHRAALQLCFTPLPPDSDSESS